MKATGATIHAGNMLIYECTHHTTSNCDWLKLCQLPLCVATLKYRKLKVMNEQKISGAELVEENVHTAASRAQSR